jgi:hypothetical protein
MLADARDLARVKRQLADLEAQERAIRDRLIPIIADADALTFEGRQILTFRANKDSNRTDWRAVAEALDAPAEVVQAHTVITPGARVLRLAKGLEAA